MYVSSVSYRTSHVICDKLAPPLITVQHLSSPLLSCGRTHTYTYTRTLSLCTGYDYPRRVLDDSGTRVPRLFNLSINCSSLCVYMCAHHPLSLVSSVLSQLHEVQLVSKDVRRLISWKLVGCDVAIITEISKVLILMLKIRFFFCFSLKAKTVREQSSYFLYNGTHLAGIKCSLEILRDFRSVTIEN